MRRWMLQRQAQAEAMWHLGSQFFATFSQDSPLECLLASFPRTLRGSRCGIHGLLAAFDQVNQLLSPALVAASLPLLDAQWIEASRLDASLKEEEDLPFDLLAVPDVDAQIRLSFWLFCLQKEDTIQVSRVKGKWTATQTSLSFAAHPEGTDTSISVAVRADKFIDAVASWLLSKPQLIARPKFRVLPTGDLVPVR